MRDLDVVQRIADETCIDAAADGVDTLEIRFAPQLHLTPYWTRNPYHVEDVVDAALRGINGRAGLILCGLWGDSPGVVELLVEIATTRKGVVGIDLAGAPQKEHRYHAADYAEAYHRAAQHGIGRTVHAGEGGPASEIRTAIEILGAQRIGHGTTLMEDYEVEKLARERGVIMEVCLTSNVHTGVIPYVGLHPVGEWLGVRVKATICTDNTLLSGVSASDEYETALKHCGVGMEGLKLMADMGRAAAFKR
jgi:adenosine deaminase